MAVKNYSTYFTPCLQAMIRRLWPTTKPELDLYVFLHKERSVHGCAYRNSHIAELFLPSKLEAYPLNLTNDDFPNERVHLLSFDEEVFFVLAHEIRHLLQPKSLKGLDAERDAEDWALERLADFRRDGFEEQLRAI